MGIGAAIVGAVGGIVASRSKSKDTKRAIAAGSTEAREGRDFARQQSEEARQILEQAFPEQAQLIQQAFSDASSELETGNIDALNALVDQANQVQQTLATGGQRTLDQLLGGFEQAQDTQREFGGRTIESIQGGFGAAQGEINNARERVAQAIDQGLQPALEDVRLASQEATGELQQFSDIGKQAFQLQGALSGALGSEAQRKAFDEFNESPGQQFLRDQGERAITRNAAKTGGRKGGEVLRALQKEAIGLSQQDFGASFNRLAQTSQQGQGAATNIASILQNRGQSLAGLRTDAAGRLVGAETVFGQAGANLAAREGEAIGNVFGDVGRNISNLEAQAATGGAGIIGQTVGDIARTQESFGLNISDLINSGAINIANLTAEEGSLIAQLLAANTAGQANVLTGSGAEQATLAERAGQQTTAGGIRLADLRADQVTGALGGLLGSGIFDQNVVPINQVSNQQFIANNTAANQPIFGADFFGAAPGVG